MTQASRCVVLQIVGYGVLAVPSGQYAVPDVDENDSSTRPTTHPLTLHPLIRSPTMTTAEHHAIDLSDAQVEILDNLVWRSLTTTHSKFAQGAGPRSPVRS